VFLYFNIKEFNMATNFINLPTLWNGSQQRQIPATRNSADFLTQTRQPSPHLSSILSEASPFPPYSLVIGLCTDGLPFMLSLDNPKSGSILVVGENAWAKSQILNAMGISSCQINHPDEVSWSVITRNAHQYAELVSTLHCQTVINPHDRASGELVIEMASIVEQRRFGRERGGTKVLMIDDFQSFVPMLSDYSVYLNLKILVSKGPACGIWPLISIKSDEAHTEQDQLLRTFGTYIFEKAEHESSHTPSTWPQHTTEPTFQPNFNVIVGGRLIPICSLSI
jgi:hypothetical protein